MFLARKNETAIEVSESNAVASDAVSTMKNFPRTKSVRDTGLVKIVSIVPRSFSPAVKSIAGYIAPVSERMMTK